MLFFAGVTTAYWAESRGNPLLTGADQQASTLQAGGNMEGKEVRFGIANSALFATVTTDASCGAVNGMHDSFTPLGGMVPLVNIMLGEVVFGGVGAGMYGMLIFVVLSVFIAGLMVGRTPEYLGKKIEAYDVKMAMLYVLIFPLIDSGAHGASRASAAVRPGHASTIAGRTACQKFSTRSLRQPATTARLLPGWVRTRWYNLTIGFAMLDWALPDDRSHAGDCRQPGAKEDVPPSPGTFPVTTPLFTVLLVSVIMIVGALTFFPALSLGPILEHLLMHAGKTF